jgi:AraC-like DNA-binding protein
MDAKNTGYKAVVTGVLVELLVFLSRSYFNCDISKSVLEVSRLGMIITKIKTDFDSNITLDTLALMANMSKWTFLRSFKKVFDMTPIQYLMNIRIAKATTMLLDTNKSISEIAMEVGFNDSNYFSRQFKKIKGMNPRSFRASFIFKAGSARNP